LEENDCNEDRTNDQSLTEVKVTLNINTHGVGKVAMEAFRRCAGGGSGSEMASGGSALTGVLLREKILLKVNLGWPERISEFGVSALLSA